MLRIRCLIVYTGCIFNGSLVTSVRSSFDRHLVTVLNTLYFVSEY